MLKTLLAASIAWQSAIAQVPASPVPFRSASHALMDSVEAAQLRFFYEWGKVWRLSEDIRFNGPRDSGEVRAVPARGTPITVPQPFTAQALTRGSRNSHLHCHPTQRIFGPGTQPTAEFTRSGRASGMIRGSNAGLFAVCPTWEFGAVAGDERLNIDAALEPQFREPVRAARKSLLALVDAASRTHPTSDFLIGQRVRLLLDIGAADSALSAARACRANRWWCASLVGHVLAVSGRTLEAEATFDTALSALNANERCRWTSLASLLDLPARDEYARMSCASRDSANAQIWWLADPLFIVPGNERRVEHYSRQVQIALRRSLDRDERFDWRHSAGGDALEEMVARYGWPAYTWWGGAPNDRSHSGYLKGARPAPLHEPYTTFEYTIGRQHLLPTWKAVSDPPGARTSDWQINATDRTAGSDPLQWWPAEHYAAAVPLYQLDDGQTAMLRRDSSIVLATSIDLLASKLPRAAGTDVNAKMVVTDRPDSVRVVAEHAGPLDTRLVLRGHIDSRRTLVGVEIPLTRPIRFMARTRFGVAPPPTLATMQPGELAISEPVILLAPAGDEPAPFEVNAALAMMAASTKAPATKRIAVYWETYGFKPTDSVDVAVWLERYTPQGFLRRFANALLVTTDPNTPVATTWREPQPGFRFDAFGGRVPIIGRSVVLDVSRMPRGDYWLEVAVAKPGQQPVRARRSLTVE